MDEINSLLHRGDRFAEIANITQAFKPSVQRVSEVIERYGPFG